MRPTLKVLASTFLSFLLSSSNAAAQSRSEQIAQEFLALALNNIQRAQCDGAQLCAPATASEKANPPLTVAEAESIVRRGTLSALAERCDLDWWYQNFLPMTTYWRTVLKKTERQLALVSLIHGITMNRVQESLKSKSPCSEEERRELEPRLRFMTSPTGREN